MKNYNVETLASTMKIHNKALKISVYILFLLLGFTSCNKVVYYAYEDKEGYYTFEVCKKEVIYRASSSRYSYTIPDFPYGYIYMNSFSLYEKNKPTKFDFNPVSLRTWYIHDINEYGVAVIDNNGTAYVSPRKTPTIRYIPGAGNGIQLFTNPKKVNFTFGNGEVKVSWMPPDLERVKKIDYEKLQRGGVILGFDYENP